MKYDVVVIGAGLAGLTAALQSLSRGSKTCVISAGAGTLYYMSGCLDLCGKGDHPWQEIGELARGTPGHPYSYVSLQEIREALSFFVRETAVTCPYRSPSDFSCNVWVPTSLGTLRPAFLVPEGQAAGAENLARVLAVDFQGYRDFSAAFMAEGLAGKGLQWQVIEVALGCVQKNSGSVDLARCLDHAWPELAPRLRPEVQGFDAVAFPAVLGLSDYLLIKQELEGALGIPVFEVPTLPPSVPGIRLDRALRGRIRELGGELLFGFPVRGVRVEGASCSGIEVAVPGRLRLIEGQRFILATGGIAGGGISVSRVEGLRQESAVESVFGFPVARGLNSDGMSFFGPEGPGYARCGVLVNGRLQPVNFGGDVLMENVFCAGRILAGYDPFREHNGAGVAIATGYKAALEAAR